MLARFGRAALPSGGIDHGTNQEGDDNDLLTLVLVKRQGRWLLAAGQNTVVRASPPPNDPAGKVSSPPPFALAKMADLP